MPHNTLNEMDLFIYFALDLGTLLVPRETTNLNIHRTHGLTDKTEH